jgi:hypothetical protein
MWDEDNEVWWYKSFFLVILINVFLIKLETSWGWAVPSSGQARLASQLIKSSYIYKMEWGHIYKDN